MPEKSGEYFSAGRLLLKIGGEYSVCAKENTVFNAVQADKTYTK